MKLYADEPGFRIVRSIDVIVVSCLCRVEVPAAVWRKHRLGEIDARDTNVLVQLFEADYFGVDDGPGRFSVVGVSDQILESAARLVAAHGLRAYDGMQLASGLVAREADPDCSTFACFDESLRAAAGTEGFRLVA